VQIAHIAQQGLLGNRPEVQHHRAGAHFSRQSAGVKGNHVALKWRMHLGALYRLMQIQHPRLCGTGRGECHRLPIQAHDPRQYMRQ